ncbi:MAG: peptidylprolyl isomerase [Ignavibacteria bacterium]|nr:peptidylprolyl isomerase [Ignavibacteria bacterium]
MKITKIIFLTILIFTAGYSAVRSQDEILAKVAGENITQKEFEEHFLRALPEGKTPETIDLNDKQDYLDLLIKFKLKVKDGRDRRLLEQQDLKNETEYFRKTFIISYFTDKKILMPYIDKAVERRKYEVRASHILIQLPEKPTPEDSLKAYERFYQILKRVKTGEDFGKIALESSDDPSAYMNNGDLYYFTSGAMVPEFEDKVYEMSIGEVNTEPVRTMFGLHIIKLTDKKERTGSVKAGHIFIRDQFDSTGKITDSLRTVQKAEEILARLKNGEDFAELAKEVSDDVATGKNGGLFGYVKRNYLIKSLDSLIFASEINQISGPVRSPAGWHIIKVFDILPLKDVTEEAEELKNELKRGQQFKNKLKEYVIEARTRYNFSINNDGLEFLEQSLDTTISFSRTKLDSVFSDSDMEKVLATSEAGKVTLNQFIEFIKSNRDYGYLMPTEENIKAAIKETGSNDIIVKIAEDENIESDPGYIKMLTEFENGLIVYKIDQEEITPSIKITDEDIKEYYDNNLSLFTTIKDNEEKVKTLEESRTEISNILNTSKFKEAENEYINELKKKYEITINKDILEKSMKDIKTEPEEESE